MGNRLRLNLSVNLARLLDEMEVWQELPVRLLSKLVSSASNGKSVSQTTSNDPERHEKSLIIPIPKSQKRGPSWPNLS